jgi:hypothetical protein
MLKAVLLSLLTVTVAFSAVPTAQAWHCAEEPLVDEAVCEVNHVRDGVVGFVLCLWNTAPSQWGRVCLAITPDWEDA